MTMKKIYIIPSVKEVKIRMEQHVCAGSDLSGDVDNDPKNNIGGDAKDDDFYTWGW